MRDHPIKELTMSDVQTNSPAVTYQSSKAEIWQKYKELKEGAKSEESEQRPPAVLGEKLPLATPSADTMESVLDDINRLRVNVSHALLSLTDAFTKEAEKLDSIRDEILKKQTELKNAHEIEMNASTLEALRQEEEQERARWEEEQTKNVLMRKRDEEEYQYGITRKKQELEDEFSQLKKKMERELQEKKKTLDSELAMQNASLKQRENDMEEERKRLDRNAKEMKEAMAKAEHAIRQETQEKMNHEKELNKQTVASLQEVIARQEKEIAASRQQLQKALEQIRDMTVGIFHSNQERNPQKS